MYWVNMAHGFILRVVGAGIRSRLLTLGNRRERRYVIVAFKVKDSVGSSLLVKAVRG